MDRITVGHISQPYRAIVSNVNIWGKYLPDSYILAMEKHAGYDVGDRFAWKDMEVVGNDSAIIMEEYKHDIDSKY